MRWLLMWFRSLACKHKWKYETYEYGMSTMWASKYEYNHRVSATCEDCGWHRKYWKF